MEAILESMFREQRLNTVLNEKIKTTQIKGDKIKEQKLR